MYLERKGYLKGLLKWSGVGSLLVFFFILRLSAFAAHDTLINPQSGSGGSYPQNPTEEFQATSGNYLLNFSAFQYKESTGNHWVKAVVTVKDRESGEPYQGPLKVAVYNDSLFSSDEVLIQPFDEPFENRYITYTSFHVDGKFLLKVTFGKGEEFKAEFPLIVGSPGGGLVLLGAAAAVLAAVGFVVYRKKARERAVQVPAG